MADTKINYVDKSWNPVTGCAKCSPGCENCYAESIAKRFWGNRKFSDVQCHEDRLEQPLKWKNPCRILVPSMGDLFHGDVPFWFLDKMFEKIICSRVARNHTYLFLTKRAERMAEYLAENKGLSKLPYFRWGATICNQPEADEKIPILLQIPAAHKWLSIEPCLEEIDLRNTTSGDILCLYHRPDWIVVGCESGPKRRPCKPEWIKSIVEQCKAAGVPCFVKQMEVNGKVVHDLKSMPSWAVDE